MAYTQAQSRVLEALVLELAGETDRLRAENAKLRAALATAREHVETGMALKHGDPDPWFDLAIETIDAALAEVQHD